MFNENGSWKEFGYQRSSDTRHTLFPFWLFAISWAFASYVIASAVTWVYPTMGFAAAAAATASAVGSYSQSEYSDSDEEGAFTSVSEVEEPPRRPRGRPRKTEAKEPRQGYYVLEPPTREGGLRKYIYYGSNPPSEEEA